MMTWSYGYLRRYLRSSRSVTPAPPPARASPTMALIVPSGPTQKPIMLERHHTWGPDTTLTFTEAFGYIGIGMVIVVFISLMWTIWLAIVGIHPNAAANFLMSTAQFDDGMMWLIVNSEDSLIIINAVSLGFVALGYAWLGARMTMMRNRRQPKRKATQWKWMQPGENSEILVWVINVLSYTGPYRRIMVCIVMICQ